VRQIEKQNVVKVWRVPEFERVELCRGMRVTQDYPAHWHDELHLSMVTAGNGFLGHRGGSLEGPPGSLTIVAPGEVHSNWSDHPEGCDFRSMYLGTVLIERVSYELLGKRAALEQVQTRKLHRDKLARQYLKSHQVLERSDSQLERESAVVSLVAAILLQQVSSRSHSVGEEPEAVRRIRDYIIEHFDSGIALERLAALTNLTPYYLNRAFRRHVGIPPHEFQIQVRISRAKTLLRKRVPIADVALSTGFADQSHFGRHFRRVVGMTPATYVGTEQERSRPS
jgi:AraC-like DNA-binding protein